MKKISWYVLLIALVVLVLVIMGSSKSFNTMLAPRGFTGANPAATPGTVKPTAMGGAACGYQEITAGVLSKIGPGLTIVNLQKVNEQYYIITVDNSSGWFWYSYYLGSDGILNTRDDTASYVGSNIFRGEVTENNGVSRLFYILDNVPYGTIFNHEIHACTLTPNGCINDTIITVMPNNVMIRSIVPLDSQDKLFMFLRYPVTGSVGIYSCSTYNGTMLPPDSCSSGTFNIELYSSQEVYTISDYGFFHNTMTSSRPENFFDVTTLTSSVLPLDGVPVLSTSKALFEPNYPLIFTLRSRTAPNSVPELIMLDTANQAAYHMEPLGVPNSMVVPYAVEMFPNSQLLSVYFYNGSYIGKQFGRTSTNLHPFDSSMDFTPMDIMPDRTVIGGYSTSASAGGLVGLFKFTCAV